MSRAGRKRKPGVKRHACGKIARQHREQIEAPDGLARARRIAAGATPENWRDTRHGYALGRLRLDETITEAEHLAGVNFATLAARFHARSGSGRPTPPAADLNRVRGHAEQDIDPNEWRKLQVAYHHATRAIPRETLTAVWAVVILDEDLTTWHRQRAPAGLSALAKHFGVTDIDTSRKSA